jgi:hypothetical protein
MRWRPTVVPKILLLLTALSLCVLTVEVVFRLTRPQRAFQAASELETFRLNREDLTRVFEVDPEFGFRPLLGNGLYSDYGTRANAYALEKPPGKTRLLFLGDSVTARAHIVEAIRDLYGDERYEYWNAAVESFNTVQEVNYYRRYNAAIRPDHVVLTFHLNDFGTTPIAFMNDEKRLVVYAPNRPLQEISPWLFQRSYTYRYVIGLLSETTTNRQGVIDEVRTSLVDLRDALNLAGARFTVLILPTLLPLNEWSADDRERRTIIRGFLEELDITFIDFLDSLSEALMDGVAVTEHPGDVWHPSPAVAVYFARDVQETGVLERGRR